MTLITDQGYTIAGAAQSSDIGANVLDRWKREFETVAARAKLARTNVRS